MATINSKIPEGPISEKWTNFKAHQKLVNPANKRKLDIIVVGTGLAGASAAASLGEMGFKVFNFCIQDSPRRAHSIAAQGGINAAKNYQNDGDSIYRLFYDTVKGGDFRSRECIELLKEADIVVTNPPFSLFREYIGQLMKYGKKFLIVGHQNAITYKEVFPLIKDNKVWLGYGFKGTAGHFLSPYEDIATAGDHKKGMIRVSGVTWFTNMEIPKRNEELDLVCRYSPEEYPKYDNYDAIEVNKTLNIPCDYMGVMGVPITFLDKYSPKQFEIIGATESEGKSFSNGLWNKESGIAQAVARGEKKYKRIFIKRK